MYPLLFNSWLLIIEYFSLGSFYRIRATIFSPMAPFEGIMRLRINSDTKNATTSSIGKTMPIKSDVYLWQSIYDINSLYGDVDYGQ